MKIQCDSCSASAATAICAADRVALCTACDRRVHAPNTVAAKHQRVALLPPPDEHPKCDVCQELPAFFFCPADRALLCRGCDFSIHSATSLTQGHDRFLLAGLRVGLQPISDSDDSSSSGSERLDKPSTSSGKPSLSNTPSKLSQLQVVPSSAPGPYSASMHAIARQAKIHHSNASSSSVAVPVTPIAPPPPHASGVAAVPPMHATVPDSNGAAPAGRTPRSSIDWRVDELLNIPDLADGYTLGDVDTSKGGDLWDEIDWSLVPESTIGQMGVVPQMDGWYGDDDDFLGGGARGRSQYSVNDDAAVPDFNNPVPSAPALKRRRADAGFV